MDKVGWLIIGVLLVFATVDWAITMRRGMRQAIELQQQLSKQLGLLVNLRHFDQLQQAALQLATLDPSDDPESWQAARTGVLKAIEDAARARFGLPLT